MARPEAVAIFCGINGIKLFLSLVNSHLVWYYTNNHTICQPYFQKNFRETTLTSHYNIRLLNDYERCHTNLERD